MKLSSVKHLQDSVDDLGLDVQAIADEHDQYCLTATNEAEALNWFHSLPIESLSESLNRDHGRPRLKYSLRDMHHKFALRKLHEEKMEELERLKIRLSIAKIDAVLDMIAKAIG